MISLLTTCTHGAKMTCHAYGKKYSNEQKSEERTGLTGPIIVILCCQTIDYFPNAFCDAL